MPFLTFLDIYMHCIVVLQCICIVHFTIVYTNIALKRVHAFRLLGDLVIRPVNWGRLPHASRPGEFGVQYRALDVVRHGPSLGPSPGPRIGRSTYRGSLWSIKRMRKRLIQKKPKFRLNLRRSEQWYVQVAQLKLSLELSKPVICSAERGATG